MELDKVSPPRNTLPKHPETGGCILLAGSGPGHPSLLTLATHTALTTHADVVFADKLVPAAILALVPPHVEVHIAERKTPGHRDIAQMALMNAVLEAAQRGLTVVRLKQGDPMVYARVGEELDFFRTHGYDPLVIPGLSAALAAPACAGIAVTQRGVADSFIVSTGVGMKGKDIPLPGYDRGRTVLLLMCVARLNEVVPALMTPSYGGWREGHAYPPYTPIALIERGSMPDQRTLVSTLEDVVSAMASTGEKQRSPGMIVVGWAVMAFGRRGGEGREAAERVLEDAVLEAEELEQRDRQRVVKWLGGRKWDVWQGLEAGWASL